MTPGSAILSTALEHLYDFPRDVLGAWLRYPCGAVPRRVAHAPFVVRGAVRSRGFLLCTTDVFSEFFSVSSFAVPFLLSDFTYFVFVVLMVPYLPVFIDM